MLKTHHIVDIRTNDVERTKSLDRHQWASGRVEALSSPLAPDSWSAPVVHSECSLHQLSPYIGKLKSSIAADLVRVYSGPGGLVADPFCGAGTIALEARLAGRRVFASDVSSYAYTLTDAKLRAPRNLDAAIREFEELLAESEQSPTPDLRSVPEWVKAYFNPRTLKEAIAFATICKRRGHTLGLSCLLGILHHQRPGFLSYPSSHLVPYLRTNRFPMGQFPELYEYRDLRSRILRKLSRVYKRFQDVTAKETIVTASSIENVELPCPVDAVITSPPYMNALDYGRDNRLRLWFIEPTAAAAVDLSTPKTVTEFVRIMTVLAAKVKTSLRPGGYCILVVGDRVSRDTVGHTAKAAMEVFTSDRGAFKLMDTIKDSIPDVRRARRDCRGVKGESVMVFRKVR
jgi:SAM-dependent methyltransferase